MSKTIPDGLRTGERWFPDEFKDDIDIRYGFASVFCKNRVVLDIGCGIGYGAKILKEVAKKVVGVDYSKETIFFARSHYSHSNVHFAVMDIEALGFKDSKFDTVVAIEVVEHIRDHNRLMETVREVLTDEGVLVLSTPNRNFHIMDERGLRFKDPYHINLLGFSRLRRLLSLHFEGVEIYGIRHKSTRMRGLIRTLDMFNIRLFLSHNKRKKIGRTKGFTGSCKPIIEKVSWWNSHTYYGFLAVCSGPFPL